VTQFYQNFYIFHSDINFLTRCWGAD